MKKEIFDEEFKDDIVFARFINYMKIALLHKKLDYQKHQDYLKSKEKSLEQEEWSVFSEDENSVHSFFVFNNDYEKLEKALKKLNKNQQYVIINHYYNNHSLNKIAKDLKLKEVNARKDEAALIVVVNKIMPLINKYSSDKNNNIDDDLRSFLIEYSIRVIKNPKLAKKLSQDKK